MQRILIIVCACVLLLAGCSPNYIELAHKTVGENLSDPASATYKNDRTFIINKATVVCGEVNAKNRMGGYVGYRKYIADGDSLIVMSEENASDFAGQYLEKCTLYPATK